ncbi:alpha/beta fold hydrolase [Streptomyces pactum]|uniref:Alpha/beta fold hydrolase n=1 Tax=Streptomyces pactum TaxID=68249 RepID=A0ABS0NQL4_9ACTN|nr:alpha/beta hydrolase [Streptomyces pactum]MBH5337498.1 alpha/beta fold hydrolase [Streptomyces pactum]
MRAAALYGVLGALAVTATLTVAPATGTAGGTATGTPGGDAEARGVALAARRAAARGITFGACPEAERLPAPVRCGTVLVPLDYARPDGRRIPLTVSRAPATGPRARHQGALVYNPGGPGGSGMRFPARAGEPEYHRLAAAYDFVGYAPRGVGRSGALSCQDPAEAVRAPTVSPARPSAEYKRDRIRHARRYAAGCARSAGRDLAHFHTLNNARDLEVLRAALGERRLTFLGASYGTYFGAVYATYFPGRVRRMVLDSVVNPEPDRIWYRGNLDQSLAFESRWADWRAWVAEHHDVYRLGRTPARVLASYQEARQRLDRAPAGRTVGSGELHAAFLRVAYHDAHWAPGARALAAYLRGDARPLIALAAPDRRRAAEEENGTAVYTAVECNDAPWPTDWSTWDRDHTELARRAPFETWENAWLNLPCAYWPVTRRQRPADVRTAPGALPPVLLVAAERDAATPYAGALRMRDRLAGSRLVTERGAGSHGVFGGGNACVDRRVETYLLTGRAPARDVSCAGRPAPVPTGAATREIRRLPDPLLTRMP